MDGKPIVDDFQNPYIGFYPFSVVERRKVAPKWIQWVRYLQLFLRGVVSWCPDQDIQTQMF